MKWTLESIDKEALSKIIPSNDFKIPDNIENLREINEQKVMKALGLEYEKLSPQDHQDEK